MRILACVLVALISATAAVPATAQVTEDPFTSIWVTTQPIQGGGWSNANIAGFRESGMAHLALTGPTDLGREPLCGELYLTFGVVVDQTAVEGIGDALSFGPGPSGSTSPWSVGETGHLTRDGRWVQSAINVFSPNPFPSLAEWQLITVIPVGEHLVSWMDNDAGSWFLTNAGGVIAGTCGIGAPGTSCTSLCFIGYLATEAVPTEGESVGAIKGRYGGEQ